MPRYTNHFTQCAAPGVAAPLSILPPLLGYFLVFGGGAAAAIFAAVISSTGVACEYAAVAIWGVGLTLIASLGSFRKWYYNQRLMCIAEDSCVVGTVAGEPRISCDGDAKIDILIAPYRYLEVEISYAYDAAINLASADPTFPMPPDKLLYESDRALRLEYVNGPIENMPEQLLPAQRLDPEERKRLYLEIVHKYLAAEPVAGAPDPRFQLRYYIRDSAAMGAAAFNNSPPDEYTNPNPNPMYRWEREPECVAGVGLFFSELFCEWILGAPASSSPEDRLVPYMHNEIEGDRMGRGIDNLQLSIGAFMAAYAAACAVCTVIPVVGVIPYACSIIAGAVAALFAWLAWLLSKIFNDPNDGTADQISVDLPSGPEVDQGSPSDDVGDLVVVYGRWIMDEEHCNYFEIHPVRAWYRVATSPGGDIRFPERRSGS